MNYLLLIPDRTKMQGTWMQPSQPPAEPIPPLRPRVAWFAVWRWKRQSIFVALLLVGYLLSPVPVRIFGHQSGVARYQWFEMTQNVFFAPIWWCTNHSNAVESFYWLQYEFAAKFIPGL